MSQPLRFEGVMPANLLPFRADLSIDEPAYRGHLRWLADVRGVTGLVVNGHAAEVSSLDREERRRALAIAVDEVRGALPVVAGVYTDGTQEAVRLARDAKAEGAAGILLFPPTPLHVGGAAQARHGDPPRERGGGGRGSPDRRLRVPAGLRHRVRAGDARRGSARSRRWPPSRTGRTTSSPSSGTCARSAPRAARSPCSRRSRCP